MSGIVGCEYGKPHECQGEVRVHKYKLKPPKPGSEYTTVILCDRHAKEMNDPNYTNTNP